MVEEAENRKVKRESAEVGGERTNKIITIAAVIIIFTLIGAAVTAVVIDYLHPNTGTIGQPAIQEYIDATPIANGATIDWGLIYPGETIAISYGITNTGNTALHINLTAAMPLGWTLTWAYNDTDWTAGQTKTANLLLTVPASATIWIDWTFRILAS